MKQALFILIMMVLAVSCKDNPTVQKAKEVKQSVSSTNKILKEAETTQDDIQKLRQTTPLTAEEWKAWLPDEVDGMKRSSYKSGAMQMMGISSMEADYASADKSRTLSLELMDGAGETGASSFIAISMLLAQDYEEITENKTKKTVTRNGQRTLEEYRPKSNSLSIEFIANNRIYVKATGKNMTPDELWKTIEGLNLKTLYEL